MCMTLITIFEKYNPLRGQRERERRGTEQVNEKDPSVNLLHVLTSFLVFYQIDSPAENSPVLILISVDTQASRVSFHHCF